jgi:ribonuclease HI
MRSLLIPKGIFVYTDGSAYHGDRSGGWAWVAVHPDFTEEDSGHISNTTISRMELHAPTMALLHLFEYYGPSDISIFSDSQYVVLGCNDLSRARKKNVRWWDRLDQAISLHENVKWTHVRGHSTNQYNNRADHLAGMARKDGLRHANNHH